MLLCWLWVIQPALRDDDPALDPDGNDARYLRVQSRIYRLGLALIGVALLGSLLALITQTQNTGSALTLGHLFDVATSTRFGYYWMLRIVLLLALATAYNSPTIWDDPPPWPVALAALGVAGACLVPFALVATPPRNRSASRPPWRLTGCIWWARRPGSAGCWRCWAGWSTAYGAARAMAVVPSTRLRYHASQRWPSPVCCC